MEYKYTINKHKEDRLMKLFKKPMTWGGWLGLCGLCFTIIVVLICRAFGFHKIVLDKAKEIKKKLW